MRVFGLGFLWVLFACLFVLTSTDTERGFNEGKSSSTVSEPAGACPPTSGCLMADQMKETCMELEGGSEAGDSLSSTLTQNPGVCSLRMVLTFTDRSCYSVDHYGYCKGIYGECMFIICVLFMPTRC